jgi:hypothetical protein
MTFTLKFRSGLLGTDLRRAVAHSRLHLCSVNHRRNEALPLGQTDNGCQIKFTEWTRDDRLRQPVFLAIREDKSANEVVREKASQLTAGSPRWRNDLADAGARLTRLREKRLSPRRAPGRSLLPLSPKRTQVRLKSLLYLVWLTPDSFPNPRRPSDQEYRLRFKRP